jgi:2-iminoacetate synthase ThiH
MANTSEYDLCHQYLIKYIEDIKKQINQLQIKVTEQSEVYPITSISLEQMDQHLKEFVNC